MVKPSRLEVDVGGDSPSTNLTHKVNLTLYTRVSVLLMHRLHTSRAFSPEENILERTRLDSCPK